MLQRKPNPSNAPDPKNTDAVHVYPYFKQSEDTGEHVYIPSAQCLHPSMPLCIS